MNIHANLKVLNQYERRALRISYIKQVWAKDMSATAIAEAVTTRFGEHLTKSAVCGIYDRNRAELADCPLPVRTATKPEAQRRDERNERRREVVRSNQFVALRPAPVRRIVVKSPDLSAIDLKAEAKAYDATALLKRLFELERSECRWPISGQKSEMVFCGHASDGPYCEHHHLRSIGRGTISERRATDDLRRRAAK